MNHLDANDRLLYFFEEKLSALKHYLSITQRMEATTNNPDHRKLRDLMSDRQKCIRKIQTSDKSIEAAVRTNRIKIDYSPHKSKGFIDRYFKEFMNIMKAVALIDKGILSLVENEGEKLKNELLTFQKNKLAVTSYRPQRMHLPRYLDKKK
jgi:hypothetical protein